MFLILLILINKMSRPSKNRLNKNFTLLSISTSESEDLILITQLS